MCSNTFRAVMHLISKVFTRVSISSMAAFLLSTFSSYTPFCIYALFKFSCRLFQRYSCCRFAWLISILIFVKWVPPALLHMPVRNLCADKISTQSFFDLNYPFYKAIYKIWKVLPRFVSTCVAHTQEKKCGKDVLQENYL